MPEENEQERSFLKAVGMHMLQHMGVLSTIGSPFEAGDFKRVVKNNLDACLQNLHETGSCSIKGAMSSKTGDTLEATINASKLHAVRHWPDPDKPPGEMLVYLPDSVSRVLTDPKAEQPKPSAPAPRRSTGLLDP